MISKSPNESQYTLPNFVKLIEELINQIKTELEEEASNNKKDENTKKF